MSCQNEPCLEKGQFTNSKDGKQFCSPECAKEFYKAPNVRVAAGRNSQEDEDEFVEVSKNHPAFNIMSAEDKETFLSFGRDKAVGLGSERRDVHRVHVAIKEALDMIGAGEDDKKRKQEDDDDARKKQITRQSYLDVLPADINVITLRYILMQELQTSGEVPPDTYRHLGFNFFKSPLFLVLFENNLSKLPGLFIIKKEDPKETFALSTFAYRSFTRAVQTVALMNDKRLENDYTIKLMWVVAESWKPIWRLGQDLGYDEVTIRTSIVKKTTHDTVIRADGSGGIHESEIMLNYAQWMNDNLVKFPRSSTGSLSTAILRSLRASIKRAMGSGDRLASESQYSSYELGAGKELYVANLVYLASWLLRDLDLPVTGENFNAMADGYLFIELVRQIAHEPKSRACPLFSHPVIVEALEIFIAKLFKYEPKGLWTRDPQKAHPYNPFRVAPKFFQTVELYGGQSYMKFRAAYTKWTDENPRAALKQLQFLTTHIPKYSVDLRLHCFHRFPGKMPKSGRNESIPADSSWKTMALNTAYMHIQSTDAPNIHSCSIIEALLGKGLWDTELDDSIQLRGIENFRNDMYLEEKQKKLDKESLMRLCSFQDRNGNVPTFKMSNPETLGMFETFLESLKETTFVMDQERSPLAIVDEFSNPATRPAKIECYNKNMPVYAKTQKKVDPFMTFTSGESYVFTLYNYVNGFVPTTRQNAHTIDGLDKLIRWYPGFVGQHRLILHTAPDRKSQTVLYVFGRDQKVDWEKHPNVQMVYIDPSHSVRVTIKNADGSLSIYEGSRAGIMIPADTEHLIQGSNVSFLSTYFPAEDEPVFKINGTPVYKEWGQPRLFPLSDRDEQAAPMEQ